MNSGPSAESSLLKTHLDLRGNSGPRQGLVTHNVTALRASPTEQSEQISQAIVGDTVAWLDEQDAWVHVRAEDAYEGWVWRHHLGSLEADRSFPPPQLARRPVCVVSVVTAGLYRRPGPLEPASLLTRLPQGARVLAGDEECEQEGEAWQQVYVPLGPDGATQPTCGYLMKQDLCLLEKQAPFALDAVSLGSLSPASAFVAAICSTALRFLGTPYVWGGTTSFGFDCSGFVQRVYSLRGVILPRDAYLQAGSPMGRRLDPAEMRLPGDLTFFCGPRDSKGRGITHVGLVMEGGRYIHAAGKEGVILTAFDDPYYSHRYADRGAWRLKI